MSTVGTATREDVEALEQRIRDAKGELAELRQRVPSEPWDDHMLTNGDGPVRLSELFGDRSELVVIHNMGELCAYCTLWGDGVNGLLAHLEDRAAVVLVSPAAPAAQRVFADSRGWSFQLASIGGSAFPDDAPGISTFIRREDGAIERTAYSGLGPGDSYCVAWDILDMLPGGAAGWAPKLDY